MSVYLRKHMRRFIAGTLAVSSMATANAAALNKTYGVLSSNVKSSVGNVLTTTDIETAELAVMQNKEATREALRAELKEKERQKAEAEAAAQAKLDAKLAEFKAAGVAAGEEVRAAGIAKAKAEAKARDEAEAKAAAEAEKKIANAISAAEAKARDDAEAKAIAAQQATQQPADRLGFSGYYSYGSSSSSGSSSSGSDYTTSSYTPEIDRLRAVSYYPSLTDHGSGTLLGNFKLTFYCPCEICNGRSDAKTASGTTMAEGRTIAVDKSIIPLGSRVYIDGFGEFIAEDTGSAIIDDRIDICVYSHERAYELGVQYGDVYLLS